MSKHTPGPWTLNEYGKIVSPEGRTVPVGGFSLAMYQSPEIQANDTLLSAAPELLEALEEVAASLAWNAHGECRSIHDGPIMPSAGAVELAKKVIAKAKGLNPDKG